MTGRIRIAIVGLGKIALDQHVPAILGCPAFDLVATASPGGTSIAGVPHFQSTDDLLATGPMVDAVALCTPPQTRYRLALQALRAGKHVLLEKPPGVTIGEIALLEEEAALRGATIFAAWHSRFAAGVPAARSWLGNQRILGVEIVWHEDVRVWHPGQEWIWEPGGLGVFDPAINALSIVTHVLRDALAVQHATLCTPSNKAMPIAAEISLVDRTGVPVSMNVDWRERGQARWEITVDTEAGELKLSRGGADIAYAGTFVHGVDCEYSNLYAQFAQLIDRGESDIDLAPLQLVADAMLIGRHTADEPFHDGPGLPA